ncbi:MAG: VWA domain-containing protein, partial [Thermoanaerobaculia bacterium]|nr:VWA domain-containing protein [Thermoanaerobaculia bacterium]
CRPRPRPTPKRDGCSTEANAAIAAGENTVKIAPLGGEWQTGLVRIDTLVTGEDIAKITFYLDNQPILTKKRPPYSVELDLGAVPRGQVLRVEAFDAADRPIASDESTLNAGQHRFSVRLVEPHPSKHYASSIRAQVDVVVPEGEVVERVELYLNETLVSTLYQEPWIQPILLPQNEPTAYVRTVAYLTDGSSTEDVVFVNAPEYLENVDVQFVELFATVLDRDQRPVEGLEKSDFKVVEDGTPQQVVRFELVRNLPIHMAAMLDVSASMEGRLEQTQAAALHFFEQAITPKDRGAIITFNDHPNLTAKYTNQVSALAAGLAGLKAERGTALWDSLIFALYYFNGIKGQRAILLLSDGKDESSRYSFAQALEFAQRAGVAIYAIGLDLKRSDTDARKALTRLANETGGRSFFVDDAAQLQAIYDTIQRELRSRYLLAYQSSNTTETKSFRTIEVTLSKPGLEVKTMRGYFP